MPCLWLLEMRRVAERRSAMIQNNNVTNTAFLDHFVFLKGNDEFEPNQVLPYNVLMKTVENKTS